MTGEVRDWNNAMYKRHPTPYHGLAGVVEKMRVRAIRQLSDIKPNDCVLEIGCEAGNLLARLPPCKRLVGADVSDEALSDATQLMNVMNRSAEFVHCDATKPLPFAKGEFSVIICSEMLEHVSEPSKVIENIARISARQTRIVLSVPNEEPKLRIKNVLSKTGLMRFILPEIEDGQSEWHLHAFSKQRFLELLMPFVSIDDVRVIVGLHVVALCHVDGREAKNSSEQPAADH